MKVIRALVRRPGSSLLVVTTLAVAIAASTVTYGVVDLLWHMVPSRPDDRLVFVAETDPRASESQSGVYNGLAWTGVSIPDLADFAAQTRTIDQFAAYRTSTATLLGLGNPQRISLVRATTNLLSVWRITPTIGHGFTAADGVPGGPGVALISNRFWREQFDASPAAVGRELLLDATPRTVVGILPAALDGSVLLGYDVMFATRFLGGRALGQRLQVGQDQISIVGVVADVRNQGILRPAAPEVFIPLHQQQGWNQVFLHVRTVGTPSVVLPAVRAAIAELDRDQPVYFVRTLDEVRDDAALEQRGAMSIVTLVAIVGLALVAVGIHGVVAYTVTSRTRDIAIRIAVGANRERVLWLVMRDVLRLVGVGAAIGFALVVMAGSTLRAVVVDVAPTDPAILLGAIAVLTVAAVLCASPPAWRACTLDPARALKCE